MREAVGHYTILEQIGRGAMGELYRGRDTRLGRTVALKMILRGSMPSPGDLARFRAEAESAARLDHPAIVPIYEVGQHDGQPFFTMKYVSGTTLARRLAEGPMPAREAAALAAAFSGSVLIFVSVRRLARAGTAIVAKNAGTDGGATFPRTCKIFGLGH